MLAGLNGKTAVVTGAAGGIGQAATRRLLTEGVRVLAVDLHVEPLLELAEGNQDLRLLQADVTKPSSAQAMVDQCVGVFGRLDLFLANAAVVGSVRPVVDMDLAELRRVFDVNVVGTFLGAQAVVNQMLKQPQRGTVLFVASTGALRGTSGMSVYSASKHAVLGLSRCLAREVADQGIRVNTLCPGPADTPMIAAITKSRADSLGISADELRQTSESGVPLGRYASPDEVAAAAAWVLSDECRFMHDDVITLSGGSL